MEQKGLNTMALRQINRAKVYRNIYDRGTTSKLQIVQELQLSLSTVNQNLSSLEQDGLIEKTGLLESTGGRPSQAISIVSAARIALGIGVLRDSFHIVAIDLRGKVLATQEYSIPFADTEAYFRQLGQAIQTFLQEHTLQADRVLGVSIAVQGLVAIDGSHITYGVILKNQDLALEKFAKEIPFPCQLIHDSKAAAVLELWTHPQVEQALVVLLNRNLGGALIVNGGVHQGQQGRSGLLEHLCVDKNGKQCYCGQYGCLETVCSVHALEQAAGVPLKEFFASVRMGDGYAADVWTTYLKHLAFGLRNVLTLVDGSLILSGYLVPFLQKSDLQYLLQEINRNNPFPLADDQLFCSSHGQYTPAMGGALQYVKKFLCTV